MKKTMTRILSLMLAVITVFGLMIAPASAASGISVSDSTSIVNVDTSGGKFFVVKNNNAKLKYTIAPFGPTYATYTKGTLIKVNGSIGSHYYVDIGGQNYFISKNDVKPAGNSFNASIDYTTINAAAFRTGPAQKCSIAYKPAKGTAFLLAGCLRNSSNNLWLVVYTPNTKQLNFLYSGNSANVCTQVKLNVSAPTNTVNTRGTLQLKASYSPSALTNSITWTSSNPYVASVNANGVVTGISAGTATITATVDGLNGAVSVSTDITVSPKISLNVPVIRQYDSRWKNKYIANSNATIGKYGCTLTSLAMVHSYKTGTLYTPDVMDDLLKFTGGGAVYWNSVNALGYYKHAYSLSAIYEQLKQGNPVIIGGKNASGGTHWVVITGYTGTSTNFSGWDFTINDPGNGNRTTLQQFFDSYPYISTLVY